MSDTHGYLHPGTFEYFAEVDEIWHAGDFGDNVVEKLEAFKPLRGVWGNIDSPTVRRHFPEQDVFYCEDVKVMMRHIGGYPPRYNPETKKQLAVHRPQLFVTGHSHILKIMFDEKLQCLHINPGAAGRQGWHKVKTLVLIDITGNKIENCRVVEL